MHLCSEQASSWRKTKSWLTDWSVVGKHCTHCREHGSNMASTAFGCAHQHLVAGRLIFRQGAGHASACHRWVGSSPQPTGSYVAAHTLLTVCEQLPTRTHSEVAFRGCTTSCDAYHRVSACQANGGLLYETLHKLLVWLMHGMACALAGSLYGGSQAVHV